jgi:hypothetical protein
MFELPAEEDSLYLRTDGFGIFASTVPVEPVIWIPLPAVLPALSLHCKVFPPTTGEAKNLHLRAVFTGINLSAVIVPVMAEPDESAAILAVDVEDDFKVIPEEAKVAVPDWVTSPVTMTGTLIVFVPPLPVKPNPKFLTDRLDKLPLSV